MTTILKNAVLPQKRDHNSAFPDVTVAFAGQNDYRNIRIVSPCSRHLNCRIRGHDIGREIGSFLFTRFPFRSQNEWSHRLAKGWITQGNRILSVGDHITCHTPLTLFHPEHIEPSVPDEVSVITATNDFVLVYKPAPMPVYPGGRYNKNTLISILSDDQWWLSNGHVSAHPARDNSPDDSNSCQKRETLHMIHRLDSVTSGLVLLGKTADFSRLISRAFSDSNVEKFYLAIVSGVPVENTIEIESPIKRKNGYIFECGQGGKPSVTHFQVLKRTDTASLILCRPLTGRTHQIRLHLREWGYPVIDDAVYGLESGTASDLPDSHADTSRDFRKVIPMQNRAISLLHCRMHFPGIGMDFRLPDSFIHSFFTDPERCRRSESLFPDVAKDYLSYV